MLIIEVADTSAGYDRSVKARLYARAGIRQMWLVDLERQHVEVLREPAARGYRTVQAQRRGDRLTIDALPQIEVAVEAILGE